MCRLQKLRAHSAVRSIGCERKLTLLPWLLPCMHRTVCNSKQEMGNSSKQGMRILR